MNTFIIPEQGGGQYRLGRNLHHDPRSIAYRVTRRSETWPTVRHHLKAPVLDQGNLGACTGYATAACLSHYDDLTDKLPGIAEVYWHDLSRSLYSHATRLDPFPGEWPDDDTGSTGLAVAKAAQRQGFLSGYQHILEPAALAAALHEGPVIVGTYWYASMFHPDADGLVTIDWDSPVAGGHEYVLDEVNYTADRLGYFGFRNSWGTGYGDGGRFYLAQDDFLRLLADRGDATKLIPVTLPAPVPVPLPVTPVPAPEPEPVPVEPPPPPEPVTPPKPSLWAWLWAWLRRWWW